MYTNAYINAKDNITRLIYLFILGYFPDRSNKYEINTQLIRQPISRI